MKECSQKGMEAKMDVRNVLAVDLGASSGRVIAVSLDHGRLEMKEIYRFPNEGIYVGDRFYTDLLYLFHEVTTGIQKAYGEGVSFDSMGIDTWGVDFALLDEAGELIGNPYHYRDSQSEGMMEKAEESFGKGTLFSETGVQNIWYNTVYQILGLRNRNPGVLWDASTFLMLPDALGYLFTGRKSLEYTSVSVTQMYKIREREWSARILSGLGLKDSLFPEVLMTGEQKGLVTKRMKGIIGIPEFAELPLIATAQHDSAASAYAVPAQEEYIFINSGTWSIIGMVMDEPLMTEEVRQSCFSNEGAAYGKVKLVKTIMGMWLIQELRRAWRKRNLDCGYDYLTQEAKKAEPFSHVIDVDHKLFIAPADMEEAVNRYCIETGQEPIEEQGVFYRTAMESLAFSYRESIQELERITGKRVDTVYLLGGAVQDLAFCQYIANATGKTVSAGPVEATAVGNALIQLKALGAMRDEKENAKIIRASFPISIYQPEDTELWDEMYIRYRTVTEKGR